MFDPAPTRDDLIAELNSSAFAFSKRVLDNSEKYNVFSHHRLFIIRKCCAYLDNLLKEKKHEIWPQNQKEPINEFQDVMQILIYAVCDRGFLFDSDGLFNSSPNIIEQSKWPCFSSSWTQSVQAYHEFAFAMRRRNFAHMELRSLREHLNEHIKQDAHYKIDGTKINETDADSKSDFSNFEKQQNAFDFIRKCDHQSGIQIEGFNLRSDKLKAFVDLFDQIMEDRLLKKVAPLIVLGVLSGTIDILSSFKLEPSIAIQSRAAQIKSYLKQNNKVFDNSNAVANCMLFSAIVDNLSSLFDGTIFDATILKREHALFDPYVAIDNLIIVHDLDLTDEEYIELANLCVDCFENPQSKQKLLQFPLHVNDVPIGEVLYALFVLFNAQTYSSTDKKKPRGWNNAIQTLEQAQIIDETDSDQKQSGECKNAGANYIEMIKEKYVTESYNFYWEVFWLITGYIPPPQFDFRPNYGGYGLRKYPFDLYAVCDKYLVEQYKEFRSCCIEDWSHPFEVHLFQDHLPWEHPSIPPELRYDIAKVRRTIAELGTNSKKAEQIWQALDQTLAQTSELTPDQVIAKSKGDCGKTHIGNTLSKFCLQQYENICSEKEKKLKSFKCYDHFLGEAMADELIQLLYSDTYHRVFLLLASLNRYIWPVAK